MKYTLNATSTRFRMNLNQTIFEDYPDKNYIRKVTELNRCLITLSYNHEPPTVGLIVLSHKNRFLKINLLLVRKEFRCIGNGARLLRFVTDLINDEFIPADVLYTVCPCSKFNCDIYQKLLIKCGFQPITIKSNGDIVYTYEKSIQKSNRKN